MSTECWRAAAPLTRGPASVFGLVDPNRSALPAHSDAQSATAADALAKASGIRAYAAIYFIGAVSTGYASLQCWKFARLHAGDLST